MTQPVFLVTVAAPAAIALPGATTSLEPPTASGGRVFVERFRASDQRDAPALARRRHPQCQVYAKVMRTSC